ncbi:MAG: TIGR04255 family protein [Micrococcales bacterium]|nr:TIGR04255 family protein [Micrococcales bacterium]
MTASTRYTNAPLVYVICQIMHPVAQPLSRGEEAALKQQYAQTLPLADNETRSQLGVGVVSGGAPSAQVVRTDPIVRFSARNRRTAVTFAPEAITLETTKYETWDGFRALLVAVLASRQDVAPVDGVERIGLRYIDEIRVADAGPPGWADWVGPQLLPPQIATPEVLRLGQQQATVQYDTAHPGVQVTLRYGAVNGPTTVGDGPIARPSPPAPGHYFLVDTDVSWTLTPGEETPALVPDDVARRGDLLHSFAKDLFEGMLTDRLRQEVLHAD